MVAKRSRMRWVLTASAVVLVAALLAAAFWPRAVPVDLVAVKRGDLLVTIDDEGRTRVHDAFVVSTPVSGRLLRVGVEPGDPVVKDETVVARMLPTNPSVLDVRTREQARAVVTAAEAALRVARADLNKAIADLSLAEADLDRAEALLRTDRVSQASVDRAMHEARAAEAAVSRAEAAISVREAEVANARAQLIGFEDQAALSATGSDSGDAIPLYAPATGRVLRVIQQNETTLPAGAPVLEVGDIDGDLEIVAELLSTDAVRVSVGDRVIVENWGGEAPLGGTVERIDPLGFTRFSALGVEEQRVNTVIALDASETFRGRLGHGYRVDVRIVTETEENAIIVPSSALFRAGGDWAVFRVEDGRLAQRIVDVSLNNGVEASLREGLSEGDMIVPYPAAGLVDGLRVGPR